MNKIAIIGSGGSGKTTLALILGKEFNLPVYHLDKLYWKPGWSKTPRDQWTNIQKELCKKDSWIIDGNYKSTLDIRLEACDTVIFLDVHRLICIYRVIKRTLARTHRPDMAEGCEERFDFEFMKFLWNYPDKIRPQIMGKLISAGSGKNVIIAKSGKHAIKLCNNSQQTNPRNNHTP